MSVYTDRRNSTSGGKAIKYLLNKHRDSLYKQESELRKKLKAQLV
jgi:hypothetical protein